MDKAHAALQTFASAQGLALTSVQLSQIDHFLQDLLEANKKVNLTADCDPTEVLLRHMADGLAAAGVLIKEARHPAPRVLDLGAGGGYIGMAVKIAWPEARVTLMESVQRKYRFLNAMAVRSGLAGLTVSQRRAGEGSRGPEKDFDAVVARALAPLAEAADLALALTAPGGLFLAYQSAPADPAEPRLRLVLARHAARLVESLPYRLPGEDRDRFLILFRR